MAKDVCTKTSDNGRFDANSLFKWTLSYNNHGYKHIMKGWQCMCIIRGWLCWFWVEEIVNLLNQFHQRICRLEFAKYDMEFEVRKKDFEVQIQNPPHRHSYFSLSLSLSLFFSIQDVSLHKLFIIINIISFFSFILSLLSLSLSLSFFLSLSIMIYSFRFIFKWLIFFSVYLSIYLSISINFWFWFGTKLTSSTRLLHWLLIELKHFFLFILVCGMVFPPENAIPQSSQPSNAVKLVIRLMLNSMSLHWQLKYSNPRAWWLC